MFWYIAAMRETVENQMSYPSTSSSFLGHSLLSVAVFFFFLICSVLLCSSFSSFLMFTVLILSTLLLFKFTKRKPISMGDLAKEEVVSTSYRGVSEEVTQEKQQESEDISEEESTEDEVGQLQKNQNFITGSEGLSSESERIDHSSTSEDSEVDWPFSSEVKRGPACSDDSISDDDSLIEIELPEVNYFGPKEEQTIKSRPNLPDFSPESLFPQEDLMGILAEINEMNEEDNLIEIDISMGSIKCSGVEIEA